jgi:hypothetical protein
MVNNDYNAAMQIIRRVSRSFTCDFPRKPRDFDELAHLKSTELRDLMLYCCPIALQNHLQPGQYEHYLCLRVAISILSCDPLPVDDMIEYAHQLLVYFVQESRELYGPTFVVYNVHSLIHLANEVRFHKEGLDKLSAWPFENYLQLEKKRVRSGKNPVAQIVKREREKGVPGFRQRTEPSRLSNKAPNNHYLIKSGRVCRIIIINHNDVVIEIIETKPFFQHPCSSCLVGFFKARVDDSSQR